MNNEVVRRDVEDFVHPHEDILENTGQAGIFPGLGLVETGVVNFGKNPGGT